jgi:hypothetical protein
VRPLDRGKTTYSAVRGIGEPAEDGADETFGRGVEFRGVGQEFLNGQAALAVLDALHGDEVPAERLGQASLREAGAFTSVEENGTDRRPLAPQLSGDFACHRPPSSRGSTVDNKMLS